MLHVKYCEWCAKVSIQKGEKWTEMLNLTIKELSESHLVSVKRIVCMSCLHNAEILKIARNCGQVH